VKAGPEQLLNKELAEQERVVGDFVASYTGVRTVLLIHCVSPLLLAVKFGTYRSALYEANAIAIDPREMIKNELWGVDSYMINTLLLCLVRLTYDPLLEVIWTRSTLTPNIRWSSTLVIWNPTLT
jgi:hypothetical protein